ncbi:hypothetical protein CALVIDRAFT_142260 [Calocera viscosa TUFC12733]|uniref:BHLH domain-containing protein n=1 Tax=Calocera viscosa (strain TUFC12733) TaxID=1330018 RepID=A0A167LQJ5_CALVF|nr:hypothetical protein CALVIDRAFT_142260 [Calocera viscosa TUFC12733]
MDPAGGHDNNSTSPSGYNTDFTFLAPSGAFQPYSVGVGLEFPSAHVGYDMSGHASADDPPPFQPVSWQAMHTPMQHPANFPPTLAISPHALTPPGSGSNSGRSGSSQGEASASPGASPASASTPPAIGSLSLSHGVGHSHSHSHSHGHRPPIHRSGSHQSGNDSSASHGSTGSMRYVVTGNESSGNESRGHKRRATKHADEDSDEDDDEDLPPRRVSGGSSKRDAEARREEIRKQRIESEQRRRDELREGYRRLKDVLPVSSQKSSKVSLLDRATQHIRTIEQQNDNLQAKLGQTEAELARLRQINETLMMRSVDVGRHGPPGYAA